jgi:hypothetical protein
MELIVISFFHETKIPTVDMKVYMYSNLRFHLQKMGVLCTHSPKRPSPFLKLPKKKGVTIWQGQGRLAAGCPKPTLWRNFFFLLSSIFWACGSTLAGWLQHMPTLPKLLLKTSNIHNFWSLGSKIMKFILTQSLLQDACLQKVSKNLKIKWGQVTVPKTGLVTLSTFSPLGVNVKTQLYIQCIL